MLRKKKETNKITCKGKMKKKSKPRNERRRESWKQDVRVGREKRRDYI